MDRLPERIAILICCERSEQHLAQAVPGCNYDKARGAGPGLPRPGRGASGVPAPGTQTDARNQR